MENLQMYNLKNPSYLQAKGLSKIWKAYYKECPREDIMEVGFNKYSGYVYIALESGITIGSSFGNNVEYLVTDFEDGYEYFYDSLEEAIKKLETL
jgi:hypothetical protein